MSAHTRNYWIDILVKYPPDVRVTAAVDRLVIFADALRTIANAPTSMSPEWYMNIASAAIAKAEA